MFEKNLNLVFLLDFYGDVLDGHTRNIMQQYYDDDLSLSEIAQTENISRQGVRHIIKKGEEELIFLEERLGLASQFGEIRKIAQKLRKTADELSSYSDERVQKCAKEIVSCVCGLIESKQ